MLELPQSRVTDSRFVPEQPKEAMLFNGGAAICFSSIFNRSTMAML